MRENLAVVISKAIFKIINRFLRKEISFQACRYILRLGVIGFGACLISRTLACISSPGKT